MPQYTQLLKTELATRAHSISEKNVTSIYFGGGTPSLLPAEDILALRTAVANAGFNIRDDVEITLEINPGTIDDTKLGLYLAAGVNRYSVGVQTFRDDFLKHSGREHTAEDSRRTLDFLAKNNLNYSFDLLFGLPGQTLADLETDLNELQKFRPNHVSLYNLTIPEKHFMNKGRASDDDQAKMFDLIDKKLAEIDIFRYELSNFSRAGFESKHNMIYWTDHPYWGLGVSAHSYLPTAGPYGTRFWNAIYHRAYVDQVEKLQNIDKFWSQLPPPQVETLKLHESLTDFCHTQLRLVRGLELNGLANKYGQETANIVLSRAEPLVKQGLIKVTPHGFTLSAKGRALANAVFLEFTFLPDKLAFSPR